MVVMYCKVAIQTMLLFIAIDNHLLECNAVYSGRYLPTFQTKLPSFYTDGGGSKFYTPSYPSRRPSSDRPL